MNKYNVLSCVFGVLGILLSDIMCAHVAYKYRHMMCGVEHMAFSASEEVAFFLAIPYAVGIALCISSVVCIPQKGKGKVIL